MNRSKREDYKRFVVFCLASLIVIAQAAIFAYVWYDFYSDLILKPFWRKGNWVMILIYALIYLMFAKLYGGLKVGYLKRIDVFYSLTLATICTNVVTYFQITLINRWFMSARPVIEMTGVQLVVTVLWIWGSSIPDPKQVSEILFFSFHPLLYEPEDFRYHPAWNRQDPSV